MRANPAGTEREWYRFWIVRLERDRSEALAALTRHDALLAAARAACLQARQRCEALERFRQKAYDAWLASLEAEERKIIDDLATQRRMASRKTPSRFKCFTASRAPSSCAWPGMAM